MRSKHETLRDTASTAPSASCWCDESSIMGKSRAITANISRPMLTALPWLLKCWCLWRIPPAKKAQPSTNKRLERIEPNSETWTMRSSPALSAKKETISSVTLPNVAFKRPPRASEVCSASCSVTKLSRSAKGAMANRDVKKTTPSLKLFCWAYRAIGKHIIRRLSEFWKKSASIDFVQYWSEKSWKGSSTRSLTGSPVLLSVPILGIARSLWSASSASISVLIQSCC
mmetsp:Transcript_3549/g.10950  ORF Transcript_3549/g.10950 Transcript_3549/m.10950 type:complete len:228 (-) Transcript_3549:160-843(-)